MKQIQIRVKFIGPTADGKGSRYEARSGGRRLTKTADHRLNPAENAEEAARQLASKLGACRVKSFDAPGSDRMYVALTEVEVRNMLDLNLEHVAFDDDWGGVEHRRHARGVTVSVPLNLPQDVFERTVPEWLQPAMRHAIKHHCQLIDFTFAGEIVASLPRF